MTTKTLLVYCGSHRYWESREIAKLVELCNHRPYRLLLLETSNYKGDWELASLSFIERLNTISRSIKIGHPRFYVASWGDESLRWVNEIRENNSYYFSGFYWNGGHEDPFYSPPPGGIHGEPYTLWVPYSAGTVGIRGVAEYLNDCWFPNNQIAMQPNVYQPEPGRGFWDMFTAVRMARKYGIGLEIEFDERMLSSFYWYRFWNRIYPQYFTAVYGGAKEILNVEKHLYG
jgi:hypothetical protein